jgi:hypothetical protein
VATKIKYKDGQEVRIGDRVRSVAGHTGTIREIFQSGTRNAKEFQCPNGGVLIAEDWNGVQSPRIVPVPGGADWDDVQLLRRALK